MEEDIGIFDPEGLLAYAAYFRDALVGDTRIAKLSDEIITDELDAILLVLEYKIGNQTLEGRLQV